MATKGFNGKAIYTPAGKAGEYSEWACNFFTGCSNDCSYCYCKRGVMSHVWSKVPKLKKCFKDDYDYALLVFERELIRNIEELKEKGIFFSFTTDPMLIETMVLTWEAAKIAVRRHNVPVQILTKRADFIGDQYLNLEGLSPEERKMIAFGFTLTGHDELEQNASKNVDRIAAMQELHDMGFRTFASIEPIIEPSSSLSTMIKSRSCCDLFKVGLMSGNKRYDRVSMDILFGFMIIHPEMRFYLKDSFVEYMGIDRVELEPQFVGKDYNIFKED